jgi:hypothetical protein
MIDFKRNTKMSNIGGVGGMGGMGGMGGFPTAGQSHQLQGLLDISAEGADKVIGALANKKGISQSQAADQLIKMFSGANPAGGASPAGGCGAGGMDDANGNGIPDKIEELVASGMLSPEVAGAILAAMGVPQATIDSFVAEAKGAEGVSGTSGTSGTSGMSGIPGTPGMSGGEQTPGCVFTELPGANELSY